MKNILHDWSDADPTKILATCRLAMAAHARLLIIEHFIGAPNQRGAGRVGDVQMMVRTGGRNRSIAELSRLLTATGFQEPVTHTTTAGPDVILAALTERVP